MGPAALIPSSASRSCGVKGCAVLNDGALGLGGWKVVEQIQRKGISVVIQPIPPFILVQLDDFDVEGFDDLRALGGYVEPPDFEAGRFVLFDSSGRKAILQVVRWDVVVAGWEEDTNEEELKQYLLRGIGAQGQLHDSDRTTDLVQQVVSLTKGSQPKLWPSWLRRRRARGQGRRG